jgi:hypothetical protein
MVTKQKSLYLHKKLEIIYLCEVSRLSKSKIGRQYGLTSSTLFTTLKNKQKIQPAVLCNGRPAMQKRMANKQNEDLKFALFKWFCLERTAGVALDGHMIKAKANHFVTRLKTETFSISANQLQGA